MRQAEGEQPEAPQQRREQELAERAEEQELDAEELAQAQLDEQPARVAHVHPPGHRVALDPARALLDPGPGAAIGLFLGHRVDQLGAVAVAGEADAEVGVFGDVVRVPAAELFEGGAAEEQGGAAERHREAHLFEPGQDDAEPGGVFDGEGARQPVGRAGCRSRARPAGRRATGPRSAKRRTTLWICDGSGASSAS